MSYCVISDIREQISENELIQLSDDNNVGNVDTSVVSRAIADAEAEINGYCGERYTVPFSPVPDIVRKFGVDIAIYNLYARRQGADDDRQKRYENAIKFFVNIAKGLVTLGVDAPDETSQDTVSTTRTSDDRIFTTGKPSTGLSGTLDNY